ncbi:MAG: ATP-binding cassette domain-containing protein [Nitrospirae bacterium]|nr:ATP-binding cassette domain-containing protein [Nitrospirota bacterium]
MELLRTENLCKYYDVKSGVFGKTKTLKAVDGISISVDSDRVFAVVGESGCGKSTLARLILRLSTPTAGKVFFKGNDIHGVRGRELKSFRKSVQVVFQDPFASLNPRMTIFAILAEPLVIHNIARKKDLRGRVSELLETVGLKPEHMNRYPHEFSGGQRQRICIARALALSPELIVADEPLSSLDVSIQAQILNLLGDLKREKKLSFVFISHDLNVVHYFADTVAVMYLGKVVEEADAETIFDDPRHPYTEMLLEAIPRVRVAREETVQRRRRPGTVGNGTQGVAEAPPLGCLFYPRCPRRMSLCSTETPGLRESGGRKVACHLY